MWPFRFSSPSSPSFDKYLKLTDKEIMEMNMAADPISTITWVDSIDENLLKERVQKMVSLNPWLTGRFVKRNGTVELGYKEQPTNKDMAELVHLVEDDAQLGTYGYKGGADYTKLMNMVGKHLLQAGHDVKNQQLWKLVIVKPNVLIVTMTHGLGDGSSYYTLFQMLISGDIKSVRVEQTFGLPKAKEKVFGGYAEAHMNENWGLIAAFVRGMITSALIAPWCPFMERATGRCFLVHNERIRAMKTEAAVGVPFVSTNDIITSWFFKTAGLRKAFMAINLRGRMDELQELDSVGNNEDLFFYRSPEDIETPALIRKSLLQMNRAVTADQPLKASELAFSSISIISNWSTFANLGAAKGFHVVGHAPVSPIEASVPSNMAIAIVFEARPGQLGVFVMGTPSKMTPLQDPAPFEDIKAHPFLVV